MSRTAALSLTIAALALSATALVGCTVTEPAAVQTSDAPTPTPAPTPTVSSVSEPASAQTTAAQDQVTCAAFGDVVTIVGNAYVAFTEKRMGAQEQSGWYALATRVLANVPSADEGPVAEALAALKEEVPAVQGIDPTNLSTPGGPAFGDDLYEACRDAGFEVMSMGFTGG